MSWFKKLKEAFTSPDESRELSAEEREWCAAFTKVMGELVGDEKFEIIAHPEPNKVTRFELVTESKRAMVAWAEIQEALNAKTVEGVVTPPGKE